MVPDNVGRFTAGAFSPGIIPGGLFVDVDVNFGAVTEGAPGTVFNPAGTPLPGTVDRVAPGDTIGWGYSAPGSVNLAPGTTSIIMEVVTNAKLYDANGTAAALDGGIANFHVFEPSSTSSVPEPRSAVLIGVGMLALATFASAPAGGNIICLIGGNAKMAGSLRPVYA